MLKFRLFPFALAGLLTAPLWAQRVEVIPADPIVLPGVSDSNSPVHWWRGEFHVTQSHAMPIVSIGAGLEGPLKTRAVLFHSYEHMPLWIESTWVDADGTVYAWYHHEEGACGTLASPKIGALVSRDGGRTYEDLGIVLETGYPPDCSSANGYFAGGHGDFTVLLDSRKEYFYFYFSNYSGPEASQGVAVARLAFADRDSPAGRVEKFYNGEWGEPGLGGEVTPIFPVRAAWSRPDADAFWGPSLHWNTHLNQYVMLLNRACCEPGWPAEGIYISFNPDLGNPNGWTPPAKIPGLYSVGWYPQVIGLGPDASDKVAGRVARFFMGSDSEYEIVFGW